MHALRVVFGLLAFLAAVQNVAAQEPCDTSVPIPGGQPAPPGQPLRIGKGSGVTFPTVTKRVPPKYPPDAMKKGVQGCVVMEVVVDTTGRPADVRVLKSIPLLDEAAVASVKQWEFTPAMRGNEPVAVIVIATLSFSLKTTPPLSPAASGFAPGRLELQAAPITADNPIPRRTESSMPEYPSEARALDAEATLVLWITVDRNGRVTEVRTAASPTGTMAAGTVEAAVRAKAGDALVRSATAAVRQWRYERPVKAPVSFGVAVTFKPDAGTTAAEVVPPVKIKHVDAEQRPQAEFRGTGSVSRVTISGNVLLLAQVGVDGRVADIRTVKPTTLDNAAAAAVRQWEYTPALRNGTPIPVWVPVSMDITQILER